MRVFETNTFEKNGTNYFFMTMGFVSGETLAQLLIRKIELPVPIALSIQKDLLTGLHVTHSQTPPIIHRDISPDNVLLSYEGEKTVAMLSDFGLAQFSDYAAHIATAAGKYTYFAPECFWDTYLPSSDVFAAGIVLYRMIIESAVDLSERFDSEHRLPDKAIDLLDRASARVRASIQPEDTEHETSHTISDNSIVEVLSETTGIPVEVITGHLAGNFRNHLVRMGDRLNKYIVGQCDAIDRITQRLVMSYSGISKRNGPLAVFLLLGPSGVGKTELAKQLALELFGSDKSLIRLDMSEYKEEHSVSKLIGSPPGYVGYEEEGQLTGKLRTRPYSILLLDEVEKAHPRVFDLFLQVFDEGRLTDSKGRRIDATNCIVVMTSNIVISKSRKLGFGSQESVEKHDEIPELKDYFRQELLNRIDEQIVFRTLDRTNMLEIVGLAFKELQSRILDRYKIQLDITDEVKAFVVDVEAYADKGVRGLRRNIERMIEAPLGEHLLRKYPADTVTVCISNDNISVS